MDCCQERNLAWTIGSTAQSNPKLSKRQIGIYLVFHTCRRTNDRLKEQEKQFSIGILSAVKCSGTSGDWTTGDVLEMDGLKHLTGLLPCLRCGETLLHYGCYCSRGPAWKRTGNIQSTG